MLCYGVVPHGVAAANPLIQHPEIPSLSLYSADIAFQRYDMLHGIFRKQKTVSKSGKWLARGSKLSRSRHSFFCWQPEHRALAYA